ncbi:ribosomal protein L17 [Phakopsora pachyrhizi]|uniref:Ribosomal protein L17 n=1 Tax=Phakopsora pachyrhizi TaxID=170000 RepID=A0AAV0ANA5_PHAPC|nr:ribosomal protein L17 [Phakopsora pachyrhizi]
MRLAKLNRSMSHRRALFRNLVSALIEHEQIKTTLPKAKAISRLTDRVITWSKYGLENIFFRRKAESYLMNWVQVRQHLFQNLAKRYENREGGYTRIHRIGYRTNDHAPLAVIELVDNPRDLKRDKVIRTVSRELALIELNKSVNSSLRSGHRKPAKAPDSVWRNSPCESELQAKKAIDEMVELLPELTRLNLNKVLSDNYVKAYQYCQPIKIPTREEAMEEVARRKMLRLELLDKAITSEDENGNKNPPSVGNSQSLLDSKTPLAPSFTTSKPKVGNYFHVKGIPTPLGPYTDFLYNVRLHFHRNLVLLNPKKLDGRQLPGFAALNNPDSAKSLDYIPSLEIDDEASDVDRDSNFNEFRRRKLKLTQRKKKFTSLDSKTSAQSSSASSV